MEKFPRGNAEMEKKANFTLLGEAARGTIEAGSDQQERLDEFTERVGRGEFHAETTGTIPCKCIDGRQCLEQHSLQPNSAGGTETLMVADDLTVKRFAVDSTVLGQYEMLLDKLASEFPVGGHTAADLNGAPSGCGANDKLKDIYKYLAENGDTVRDIAASLGVEIDNDSHAMMIDNAANRTDFSRGDTLLATLREKGTDESVDTLKGGHKEVVAVINTRPGTTLDRDAVVAEFGEDYQAFNVDVWAFEAGARAISEEGATEAELKQKVTAMVYYNLATAGVLCGPSMRVVVL